MKREGVTRRSFLSGTTSVALGAMIVPRHILGGRGWQAPSDHLNIAVVGAGAQGATDAAELVMAGEKIVALADVDLNFVDASIERRTKDREGNLNPAYVKLQEAYAKARRFSDFRRMLEEMKEIDAVLVATPDHTHAVVAQAAMELGKHVYVEKPLTHSVHEARVLRETARRTGVVTQMGNQGHSADSARRINEWIQADVIGPVREVHIWTNRPIWPQGIPRPGSAPDPRGSRSWSQGHLDVELAQAVGGTHPIPQGLAWDLFLGPAPGVEYHPLYHPFNWRGWIDWGTGALGDMGAHLIDHPYWALGLKYPSSVESTSTPFGLDADRQPVSYPLATQTIYRFPARGSQPPVTMTWNDGGLMPPRPALLPADEQLLRMGGVILIGDKGALMHETYGRNPRFFPASLMEDAEDVPKTSPRVQSDAEGEPLHRVNWARAARGEGEVSCPFDYAAALTEVMLLGIVALRTGQGALVKVNSETGEIISPAEARQYVSRTPRPGWEL